VVSHKVFKIHQSISNTFPLRSDLPEHQKPCYKQTCEVEGTGKGPFEM